MIGAARYRAVVCAALMAGVVAATPAWAQSPPPGASADLSPEAVAAIARDLNCPVCQGYTLQDCPLTVCAQMRDIIRGKLAAGESREAIMAAFVAEYGPQVLNEPPTEGLFLSAWLLPVVALVGGAIALGLWLRRRVVRAGPVTAPAPAAPAPEPAPALVARLEQLAEDREGPG